MFAFLFLVAVWQGRTDVSSINGRALLFIALSGIAGALSWLFYFMAVKDGRVPAVIAIDKTSVALAIFLSWIILKEELTPGTVLGALLIVVGALLVSPVKYWMILAVNRDANYKLPYKTSLSRSRLSSMLSLSNST